MSRSHRATRISRPLIGALGVSIILGGAVYFHHHKPRTASADPLPLPSNPLTDAKSDAAKLPDAIPPIAPKTAQNSASVNTAGAGSIAQPGALTLVTQTPMPGSSTGTPSAAANDSPLAANKSAMSPTAVASANPQAAFPAVVSTANIKVTADTLVEGKAKKDAGDLVGARDLINAALLSDQLSEQDADASREMLTEISQKLIFSPRHVEGDAFTDRYQVMSGDRLSRIADRHGVTWEMLCKINGLSDPKRIRSGQWVKIINGPFHAVVTKSKFRLDLYLGNPGGPGSSFVMSLPVGLGKDNSTPTGLWQLQPGNKAHPATYYSPRGEGVIAADDPRNPLGGYWMGITGVEGEALGKSSYGIHGTTDQDSIGKQASMGCIRLKANDIAFLYDALVEGKTKVMIKD